MNDPSAQVTQGKGQAAKGDKNPENGSADQGRFAGRCLIFLVLFVVFLVALSYWIEGGLGGVKLRPGYIILALVGVVFHIASKYREAREEEGFSWEEYGPDYLFRAFQACVYVVVIQNLVGLDDTKDPGVSWNMSLIALFVGMYIRKVEKAFESLGDRFGDMLSGIFGTTVQRLSPVERRKKLEELHQQFLKLKNKYSAKKGDLEPEDQSDLDAQFLKAKELLQKGRLEAADIKLLNLEFRLKELKAM